MTKFLTINENLEFIIKRIYMLFNYNVNSPIKVLINYEKHKIIFIINYKNIKQKIKLQLCKVLNELQINKLINQITNKIDNIYNK